MNGKYYFAVYEDENLLWEFRCANMSIYPETPGDELDVAGYIIDENFKPRSTCVPGLYYLSRWAHPETNDVAYVVMFEELNAPFV
jgi:hypothetical protein